MRTSGDRVGGDLIGNGAKVLPPPPPEMRFKRKISLISSAKTAWRLRELSLTLAERELRARYKQAFLGFAWALVIPVILMVVFTLFINRLSDVETRGVPYPLFTFVALVPWTFFSVSINQGGQSLIANSSLLNKINCPRELFPAGSILVAGVDALVSTLVLVALFIGYGFLPHGTSIWVPVLLAIQIMFTLGLTFIVAATTVYVRDLRQAIPILLQLALFASPVAYPVNLGERLERFYALLNPLAPVIDGYRSAILYGRAPEGDLLMISAAMSVTFLVGGYWVFKHLETGFADVA